MGRGTEKLCKVYVDGNEDSSRSNSTFQGGGPGKESSLGKGRIAVSLRPILALFPPFKDQWEVVLSAVSVWWQLGENLFETWRQILAKGELKTRCYQGHAKEVRDGKY